MSEPTMKANGIDMIYLVGGAPRAGKSILGQRISAKLEIGWISTDLLMELLRVKNNDISHLSHQNVA